MEFTEIGEKLGGLTADQVFNLAEFGKKVLDHTGIVGLSSGIITATDELMEKCWGEKKTPFGLTGVQIDNDYFGLKKATDIQTL